MQELAALLGIMGALAVGTMSPGPSFVMVARLALATSRAKGLAAAAGMGAGGVAFAVAALVGLHAVLLAVPTVYLALKLLGALFLCYLGIRILLAAKVPLKTEVPGRGNGSSLSRAFWLGLTTQLSNPKTAVVYASVFAAFLPGTFSMMFAAGLVCAVFTIEAGWYAVVAAMLSSPGPRRAYLSYKAWVDRAAGVVMVGLSFKLFSSAQDS